VIVGDDGRVRVLDFGLARAVESAAEAERGDAPLDASPEVSLTATGALIGTPLYMSPEQWAHRPVDARSDQFSYCVALHQALAGRHPFDDSSTVALRESVLDGPPPAMPASIPARLRPLLRRGLARAPDERFGDMDALLAALARRPWWRGRVAIAAGLVAAIGVAAVALSAPAPAIRGYRSEAITSRGDVLNASLSHDGNRVAFIAHGSLFVRDLASGGDERAVVRDRVCDDLMPTWSPDDRGVGFAVTDERGGYHEEIVDVATGRIRALPMLGYFAIGGDGRVASVRQFEKEISFHALETAGRPIASCALPGAFEAVSDLRYVPATRVFLVALDHDDRTRSIVELVPDCRARTIVSHGSVHLFAPTVDGERLLVQQDDGRLVEVGRDGRTRAVRGKLSDGSLVGVRRDGQIVQLLGREEWRLLRIRRGLPRTELAWGSGSTVLALSPDRASIAQVDRGALRVRRLDDFEPITGALASRVRAVGWSPDGARLAATIDRNDQTVAVRVIDVATGAASTDRAVPWAAAWASVTWLDDHRVALEAADGRTYRSLDLRTGADQDVMDRRGYPSGLSRSASDGALAFVWALPFAELTAPRQEVWLIAPGQAPTFVSAFGNGVAWSPDGASLIAFDEVTGTMRRFDRSGRVLEELPRVELSSGTRLEQLDEVGDGLVAHTVRFSADLQLGTPE